MEHERKANVANFSRHVQADPNPTAIGPLHASRIGETVLRGGTIFAWGKTDIHDRESELHRRYEIGIASDGTFHSIDTGKLTLAPYFAKACADRILGS